jgi:hypothetical protein
MKEHSALAHCCLPTHQLNRQATTVQPLLTCTVQLLHIFTACAVALNCQKMEMLSRDRKQKPLQDFTACLTLGQEGVNRNTSGSTGLNINLDICSVPPID